jgi:hypothetical protein
MMAKMKYSEIPRDMSSDSVAALRLAQVSTDRFIITISLKDHCARCGQGSPDREGWRSYQPDQRQRSSPESKVPCAGSPSRIFHPANRRSTSAFRSHCLGRKESPEPEGSMDDMFIPDREASVEKDHHRSRRGNSPNPYVHQQFK